MIKFLKNNIVFIIILVIVILLKIFVITTVRVSGSSMIPTLKHNDIMLLNKTAYLFEDIKRFDIVVIKSDTDIIKRVIGLPGEKIEYVNNELYVNGKRVEENFDKIPHRKEDGNKQISLDNYNTKSLGSLTVPENCYFVLGDNRVNSTDSRILGFIKKENILGKTSLTIFPFSRFGNKSK